MSLYAGVAGCQQVLLVLKLPNVCILIISTPHIMRLIAQARKRARKGLVDIFYKVCDCCSN